MALSEHEYDKKDEYKKCEKCLDTFHIDEVDWKEIEGYTLCDYCIGSFILDMIEMKKDPSAYFKKKY